MGVAFNFFLQMINTYGPIWMIGQAFGIVAIVLGFLTYQTHTQAKLILLQTLTALSFCIHYGLLGAYAGMAANLIVIVRNTVYDYRLKRNLEGKRIPILFVALQVLVGILMGEAWYSLFIILGIGINSYFMSLKNAQTVRWSILVSSPCVLIYDLFARSIGGTIFETVAVISALIGILRYRKHTKKDLTDPAT